jgi:hypothetical protein
VLTTFPPARPYLLLDCIAQAPLVYVCPVTSGLSGQDSARRFGAMPQAAKKNKEEEAAKKKQREEEVKKQEQEVRRNRDLAAVR